MRQLLPLLIVLFFPLTAVSQTAHPDFVDGAVWVKLKRAAGTPGIVSREKMEVSMSGFSFDQPLKAAFGLKQTTAPFMEIRGESPLRDTYLFTFKDIHKVDELIEELRENEAVDYVEKVPLIRPAVAPAVTPGAGFSFPTKTMLTVNDPSYGSQWHLPHIGAEAAWNYFSTGSNTVIAIIDDAVNITHPDLAPNLWVNPGEIPGNGIDDDGNGFIDDINGWDFAGNDNNPNTPSNSFFHGTHVAGIASAATNNAVGIAGIGFSCKIMALKASATANSITHGLSGIIYAADNKASIINCSWGTPVTSMTLQNAVSYAREKGCIIVAAAGNDNSSTIFYPAGYPGVVSVASTTNSDTKSGSSSYGAWVTISAPGVNIYSTLPGNTYGLRSGTSMAAPLVAGLLGLMHSLHPGVPAEQLVQCLTSSADPIDTGNPDYAGQLGAGRINAAAAMQCVSSYLSYSPIADFSVTSTTVYEGGNLSFNDLSAYAPVTWEWEFEGGIPASHTGQNPPVVTYHTAGIYKVSLTVTNANGSHTVTKEDYITVREAPGCVAVNLPAPGAWTPLNYYIGAQVGEKGWINGVSEYLDKEKAMFFDLSAYNGAYLTKVFTAFGQAYSEDPSKTVPLRIYDGTSNTPGATLGSSSVSMETIMDDKDNGRYTVYTFGTPVVLPVSRKIFVSVDLTNLEWSDSVRDTLSIVSNTQGQTSPSPTWEKQANDQWYRYTTSGSWPLLTSLYIHPFITDSPPVITFTSSQTEVCAGGTVSLDATGSTYQHGINWISAGGVQVGPNSENTSFRFDTPGTHTVTLQVQGGGCADFLEKTMEITVLPLPEMVINVSKNPLCEGESATISVSGAESYSWSPSSGLNTDTGAVVTTNTTSTTTYTVTGTLGTCTAQAPIQLEVRPLTASVTLQASANNVPAGTNITFTATADNGGVNPTFDFRRNGESVQQSEAPVWSSNSLANNDEIRCFMTSDEACVTEPDVASEQIVVQIQGGLPVQLLDFRISAAETGNLLLWEVVREHKSAYYLVERSSDAKKFRSIGSVAATHTIESRFKTYHFNDISPAAGAINYYRLRMTDLDGSFAFSPVVARGSASPDYRLDISPNPVAAGSTARVTLSGLAGGTATLRLYDQAGKAVRTFQVQGTGEKVMDIPVGHLTGLHHLTCFDQWGMVTGTARLLILK